MSNQRILNCFIVFIIFLLLFEINILTTQTKNPTNVKRGDKREQLIYLTSTNRKTFSHNLFYIFFDLLFSVDRISFFIIVISCKILKIRYIGIVINPITRIVASNSLFSATPSSSIIFAANKIKNSNVMRLFINLFF